jgi:hypothetical protein
MDKDIVLEIIYSLPDRSSFLNFILACKFHKNVAYTHIDEIKRFFCRELKLEFYLGKKFYDKERNECLKDILIDCKNELNKLSAKISFDMKPFNIKWVTNGEYKFKDMQVYQGLVYFKIANIFTKNEVEYIVRSFVKYEKEILWTYSDRDFNFCIPDDLLI